MPRRQKLYHYIYKTTCLVTGKFYVGMHSTDIINDDYLGSGKILGYSIAKHGRENHKREIIEIHPSREALKLREKEIVNEQLLADPLNINLKYGGDGGGKFWSKEHQRKAQVAGALATNKIRTTRLQELHKDENFKKRLSAALSRSAVGTRGQVWLKRDGASRCASPEEAQILLSEGWTRGRNYKRK